MLKMLKTQKSFPYVLKSQNLSFFPNTKYRGHIFFEHKPPSYLLFPILFVIKKEKSVFLSASKQVYIRLFSHLWKRSSVILIPYLQRLSTFSTGFSTDLLLVFHSNYVNILLFTKSITFLSISVINLPELYLCLFFVVEFRFYFSIIK